VSRLIREPLVHFLAAGAALFALYGLASGAREERRDRIVVSEAQVASLAEAFARTWMRPPKPSELRGLVDDYVREEVLYREALALGLDRDDLVVRRRMRQKMEFLNQDLVEADAPTEAELRAFFEANAEAFRVPERISVEQIFVDLEKHGAEAEARAAAWLARLRERPEAREAGGLGDPTLLPRALSAATLREIDGIFGGGFGEALASAPPGAWIGPIASAYGLHVVRVAARDGGRLPPFEEVRGAVEREWSSERRKETDEAFYRALRDRYEVEVRLPDAAPAEAAPAEPLASRAP
jgi:hypothetical protein